MLPFNAIIAAYCKEVGEQIAAKDQQVTHEADEHIEKTMQTDAKYFPDTAHISDEPWFRKIRSTE